MNNNKVLTLNDLKEALMPIMKILEKNQTINDQIVESQNSILAELNSIGTKLDLFNIKSDNLTKSTTKQTRGKKAVKNIIDENQDNKDNENDEEVKEVKKTTRKVTKKTAKSNDETEDEEKTSKSSEKKAPTKYNYFRKIFNKDIEEYKNIVSDELSEKLDKENKSQYLDDSKKMLEGLKLLTKKCSLYYKHIQSNKSLDKLLDNLYKDYLSNPDELDAKLENLDIAKKTSKVSNKSKTNKTNKTSKKKSDNEDEEQEKKVQTKKNIKSNTSEKSFNSKNQNNEEEDDELVQNEDELNYEEQNDQIEDDDQIIYDDEL